MYHQNYAVLPKILCRQRGGGIHFERDVKHFMRGIRLSRGVTFVEQDGVTVRIKADGTCGLSPIMLPSLEWDLRTEPPETWEYIFESDLNEDTREQIKRIVETYRGILGNENK